MRGDDMNIGLPLRIIEVDPLMLPLPEVLPEPDPRTEPAPREPVPAEIQ
jgi:hypothetical protein